MIGFYKALRDNTNLEIEIKKFQPHQEQFFLLVNTPAFCLPNSSFLPPHHHPSQRIARVAPSCLSMGLAVISSRELTAYSYLSRCQSRIARTLPADQKPECRPYWEKGDPLMPLPFDLTEIVSELRGLLLETRP